MVEYQFPKLWYTHTLGTPRNSISAAKRTVELELTVYWSVCGRLVRLFACSFDWLSCFDEY